MEGSLSANVGAGNKNLALAYEYRAKRARTANDLDRELSNLEQALTHYREAARIYRAANRLDKVEDAEQRVVHVEGALRQARSARGLVTIG